jgi:hypothetical protein
VIDNLNLTTMDLLNIATVLKNEANKELTYNYPDQKRYNLFNKVSCYFCDMAGCNLTTDIRSVPIK